MNPVWIMESIGKNGIMDRAKTDDTSQPSARLPVPSAVRVHISATVEALNAWRPSSAPPRR